MTDDRADRRTNAGEERPVQRVALAQDCPTRKCDFRGGCAVNLPGQLSMSGGIRVLGRDEAVFVMRLDGEWC